MDALGVGTNGLAAKLGGDALAFTC